MIKSTPDGNYNLVPCCDRLEELLKEDILLSFSDKMFGDKTEGVFFLSEGGHHGVLKINYCPFCGSKINPVKL